MCLNISPQKFNEALKVNRCIVSTSQFTSRLSQISIKDVKYNFKRGGFHVSNSLFYSSHVCKITEVM